MSNKKSVAFATYNHDWRRITKTKHVSQDKERMKRWRMMSRDDEVLFGLYDITKNSLTLLMESGATLVVGLGANRERDSLITIIPPKNSWKFNRKYKLRWDWPIVEIPANKVDLS